MDDPRLENGISSTPAKTRTISARFRVNYQFIRSFPAKCLPIHLVADFQRLLPPPIRADIIVSRFFRIHPPTICLASLLWKSGRYSPIQQILDRLVSVLQIQIPRLPGQHYRRLELRQVGRKFVIELERGREHHAAPFVHGYRNRDADRELENEGGGTSFRGLNNFSQGGRKNRGEGGGSKLAKVSL